MKKVLSFAITFLMLLTLSNANAMDFAEVRSAEVEVIEKCYGEKIVGEVDGSDYSDATELCGVLPDNILPTNTDEKSIKLNGHTYTFALRAYYIPGVTLCSSEDAYVLLTGEYKDFLESIVTNIKVYNENDKSFDSEATEKARAKARAEFETFVADVQAKYSITEVYHKEVFMRQDLLEDADNRIFAISKENELIGVKTDKDNNVFRATNGEYIEEVMTDEKIYNKEDYFYLCKEDSMCGDCNNRVAYGVWCGEKYFSKYCVEHSCLFVKDHETDVANEITTEGLKCIRKTINGAFCGTHKCRYGDCTNGIVGLSAVGELFNDIHLTGNAYLNNYSRYCAEHKCRAVMCKNLRVSQDMTIDKTDTNNIISTMYCESHKTGCKYMIGSNECGNPVTEDSYEKSGFKMLCDDHRKCVKNIEKSKNGLMPRLTRCLSCGQIRVAYIYSTDDEGKIMGLCTPCLRSEWVAEFMSDVNLSFELREIMRQDSRESKGYIYTLGSKYAIKGDVFNLDGTIFTADSNLRMVRGQRGGFIRTTGSWGAYDDTLDYEDKDRAVITNCVMSGMNTLSRVFNKYGLKLYNKKGHNIMEQSGQWLFKEKDSDGNYTETEFNLSTLTDNNGASCVTWSDLSTGDIISPLISEIYLEGDKYRKDFIKENSPSTFVSLLKNAVAINSKESERHTGYPVKEVDFIDPTTGETVSGILIHNVSFGNIDYNKKTGKGEDAQLPMENVYFVKIVEDENGNECEQLVRGQLSKNADGTYYISPNLYYNNGKSLTERTDEDGWTYGYKNNEKEYKLVDGVRCEVDSSGNFVYSNAYKEITLEDVVSSLTGIYFFNGDMEI